MFQDGGEPRREYLTTEIPPWQKNNDNCNSNNSDNDNDSIGEKNNDNNNSSNSDNVNALVRKIMVIVIVVKVIMKIIGISRVI